MSFEKKLIKLNLNMIFVLLGMNLVFSSQELAWSMESKTFAFTAEMVMKASEEMSEDAVDQELAQVNAEIQRLEQSLAPGAPAACSSPYKYKKTNRQKKGYESNDGRIECDECGKRIVKGHMPRHKMIHTGERPFECGACRKSFKTYYDFSRHMKRLHIGEKSFECMKCGKTFTDKDSLTSHLKVHEKKKLFKCNKCGKSFSRKVGLVNHKAVHSRVKVECAVCGQSFASGAALKKHALTHGDGP